MYLEKMIKAQIRNARVSLKHSITLCRHIKGKKLEKARRLLEDLINKKRSINGKYYTNTAKKLLEVLKNAEANAKNKGLNLEKVFVKVAKADKGGVRHRARTRFTIRPHRGKSTHLYIELEER